MIIGYVLLALGVAAFVLSFVIPMKTEEEKEIEFSEEMIKELVSKEVEEAKDHLNDIVDETITYAMEKTERSIDRITNEKIMAVNEYSDTVLGEIDKNHKEVVFLYDMLNDKHDNLMETVSVVEKKTNEVKEAMLSADAATERMRASVDNTDVSLEVKEEVVEAPTPQNGSSSAIDRLRSLMASSEKEKKDFVPFVASEIPEVRVLEKEEAFESPVVEAISEPEFNSSVQLETVIPEAVISEPEADILKVDISEIDIPEIDISEIVTAEANIPEDTFSNAKNSEEVSFENALETVVMETVSDDADVSQSQSAIDEATKQKLIEEAFGKEMPDPILKMQRISEEIAQKEAEASEAPAKEKDSKLSDMVMNGPSINLGTDGIGKTMGGRNNNERILELHKAGKSNMAISKELGLGLGEVKLVIGLFEGK